MGEGEVASDPMIKKQGYNPHDYVDDALLDKLYYTSNATDPYLGPEKALYGLVGYSAALSGHYLYKQLSKYLEHRINDMDNNEIEIGDDDETENESVNVFKFIKRYKQ